MGFLSTGIRTPFGKRMLKRWIVSPLTDKEQIVSRQEAVSDLVAFAELRTLIQTNFKKLPDIERLLTRIFTYSIKSKVKAFYVDQQALQRLEEFHQLLETFRSLQKIVSGLAEKYPIKSARLIKLLTVGNKSLFPDYSGILDEFDGMITWKKSGSQRVPEPKIGQDEEFDACNFEVDQAKRTLNDYLSEVKKTTGCKEAVYSSVSRKFRYEIELPEAVEVDEDDFICTSKVKGKRRYQTEKLQELISELEAKEEILKQALVPFLRGMFRRFYEFRNIFQNACSCISEIDCLNALAVVSADKSVKMCKPKILQMCENSQTPILEIKAMRHPCVVSSEKRPFVSNDMSLSKPATLLITVPNMGGKSTLLRQTCLLAIMA